MLILFLVNLGYIVDAPNTYIPTKGTYEIGVRIGAEGSIIGQLNAVIFEKLSIGVSYGGNKILGRGEPEYHKTPGVQIKTGMQNLPVSWAIGFDSEDYDTPKRWIYGVLGGSLAGKIIPSIGVNYYKNLETFGGVEAGISEVISVNAEWILSKNQSTGKYFSTINCGLRFKFEDKVIFEFLIKDVSNKDLGASRGIKFSYSNFI